MARTNGKKRVTFTFDAPEAKEVFLCGTFNDWCLDKTPLKRDARGKWKAQIMLAPGTYEYRLRVDGVWTNDPAADGVTPNPFGTENCVRQVPAVA
jgi:1,4-alpha-glucan branching enzyme